MMAKRTKEEIQKQVAEASAARKEEYFKKQTAAKEAAAKDLPPLPAPDAYVYNYAWRQEVGGPGGKYKLTKTQNPFYDPSTNEIVDPVTGKRTKMVPSMYGGTSQTTATLNNVVANDAVQTALNNRSWLSIDDPMKSLEALGKIIGQFAKPGTQDYMSYLISAANMGSRSHTDIRGETGTLAKFLAKNISYEQGKAIGIDTIAAQIGKDAGSSYAPEGGLIGPNDPYVRDQNNKIVYGEDGLPQLKGIPVQNLPYTGGGSIQNLPYYGGGSIQNMGFAGGTSTQNMGLGNLTSDQSKSLSAFEVFRGFLNQYGLGGLAADVEKYKLDGLSDDELLIRLRTESKAYQRRFAANEARVAKGLTALSEAVYIGLEDQYQDVMRRYGMPATYYTRGDMGRQEGFEKFIANDVSPVELEDRVQTAYNRVINANPEVGIALRNFYPSITNGDILAYSLDPNRALSEIQRKITAAEIGGAAVQSGLTTNESDAEYLARYGITKEQAQQGYRTISGFLPRAQQLSNIYGRQIEGGPYTQASAEREVFNVPGAAEEERKRQKITALEQAQFGGSSGLTQGALGRERAGQF